MNKEIFVNILKSRGLTDEQIQEQLENLDNGKDVVVDNESTRIANTNDLRMFIKKYGNIEDNKQDNTKEE